MKQSWSLLKIESCLVSESVSHPGEQGHKLLGHTCLSISHVYHLAALKLLLKLIFLLFSVKETTEWFWRYLYGASVLSSETRS